MRKNDKLRRHIMKKYYKNDKKVITVTIKDEKELYNSLDGSNETLSDAVTDYLECNTETLLSLSNVTIKIECKKEVDLEHFSKCLKLHYGISLLNCERINKLAFKKKLLLLCIAIVAFILTIFTKNMFNEILTFIGTLAVWELADVLVFTEEEDRIEEYIYEVLKNAKVE